MILIGAILLAIIIAIDIIKAMMRWLDSKLRHKAWWRKWRGLPEPMPIYLAAFNRDMLSTLENCLKFSADVNQDCRDAFAPGKPRTIIIRRPQRFTGNP